MSVASLLSWGVRIVTAVALLCAPLVHRDGLLWVMAAMSALTVYQGARARVVYAALTFMVVIELLYGGDAGSVSIAYACSVVLLLQLRRIVSLPAWAQQDGWRLTDAVRTVFVSGAFCIVMVCCSILVGDALYGYGHVIDRMAGLLSARYLLTPFAVSAVFSIGMRRMAIPFRREILFGT